MKTVLIDGNSLTIEDVVAVARNHVQVKISEEAKDKIIKCRKVVEEFVKEKRVIYGVTTGFGALSNITIPQESVKKLQSNMIKSHSAGVGKPLSKDVTRALMLLRANTLAKGHSGVRLETLETLVHMLNKGVHPIIPEKGSVGASGDLAPLAHMALVMIGEGEAEYKGKIMSGREAMKKAGIDPIKLDAKEGLALTNGTQLMTAIGALAVYDAERLVKTAEIATAMSLEALCGILDAFDERIQQLRPHQGQIISAQNIRLLVDGSKLVKSSSEAIKEYKREPHDPYCLRCAPQVLGGVRDAIAYVRKVIETEINSATDNPLILVEDKECISAGNFHGQPIAIALDLLGIALATVGNISERRIARLVDEKLNLGLPAFLVKKKGEVGLHSGFMIAQYTAASLASENKVLAHPASVDSIPTSANFEDFVSMGPIAAIKAMHILENVRYILAIELLCAAQGVDFRGPNKLGKGTRMVYSAIRKVVPMLKEDRVLHKDIESIAKLIESGQLLKVLEKLKLK